jgi:hypothetical protein
LSSEHRVVQNEEVNKGTQKASQNPKNEVNNLKFSQYCLSEDLWTFKPTCQDLKVLSVFDWKPNEVIELIMLPEPIPRY